MGRRGRHAQYAREVIAEESVSPSSSTLSCKDVSALPYQFCQDINTSYTQRGREAKTMKKRERLRETEDRRKTWKENAERFTENRFSELCENL